MSVAAPTAIDCASRPVDAALWLARAFTSGRALAVRAPGCADHAHHVAVEFVHPVVAGARSLPAAAEGSSTAGPSSSSPSPDPLGMGTESSSVTGPLPSTPSPLGTGTEWSSIADPSPSTPGPLGAGTDARWCHLLIGPPDGGHFDLSIPTDAGDAATMTGYHLLWELVQVALEHPGLVGGGPTGDTTGHPAGNLWHQRQQPRPGGGDDPPGGRGAATSSTSGSNSSSSGNSASGNHDGGDSTGFLYPFLDAAECDEASLREALGASAAAKRTESERLAAEAVAANRQPLEAAAALVNGAVTAGRRVLVMGNGGSATDAARLVRLLRARGTDAVSLAGDYAVVSALANDLGAEAVFARQIEALGTPGDVLIGCSTSGTSPNLLAAFERASAIGMRTVGISGYGGGAFTDPGGTEVCLSVASDSVHRIQEAEAALIADLCRRIEPGSP